MDRFRGFFAPLLTAVSGKWENSLALSPAELRIIGMVAVLVCGAEDREQAAFKEE
jgi:hypothetical protein